jgi:Zn-dependent protease with chaperone function
MELEDLKDRWNEYDRKLDANLRLNSRVLREFGLNRVDSSLRRLTRLIVFELMMGLVATVLLGGFIADHLGEMRFLVPAVALDVFVIYFIGWAIRQWMALASLDYGESVMEIQRKLELLRIDRIRMTKWVFLLSPLLWIPLLIVGVEGLVGVDAYATFDTAWLVSNFVFGLAVIALALWVSRRYADRLQGSPLARRLADALADRSLVEATGFLGTLSSFERENGTAA